MVEKVKDYNPSYYHPCRGCHWFDWDGVGLNHGDYIQVPFCSHDFHLATDKCPCYQTDEEYYQSEEG